MKFGDLGVKIWYKKIFLGDAIWDKDVNPFCVQEYLGFGIDISFDLSPSLRHRQQPNRSSPGIIRITRHRTKQRLWLQLQWRLACYMLRDCWSFWERMRWSGGGEDITAVSVGHNGGRKRPAATPQMKDGCPLPSTRECRDNVRSLRRLYRRAWAKRIHISVFCNNGSSRHYLLSGASAL